MTETCVNIVALTSTETVLGFVNGSPYNCDETGLICVLIDNLILNGTVGIC